MPEVIATQAIGVWYGEQPAEDQGYQQYWTLLSAAEQARAERMRHEKHRQQYIYTQGRLRILLAEYTATPPDKISFAQGEFGKPYLRTDNEITFNLSHSGNKIAVAIGCQCQLGVDIEVWKDRLHLAPLAKKCFAPVEWDYWLQLPKEQKIPEFYSFWTKKESFVKAVGRGIALGMDKCVISPQQPTQFLSIPGCYGRESDWKVHTLDLSDGISGALTLPNKPYEIRMRSLLCEQ